MRADEVKVGNKISINIAEPGKRKKMFEGRVREVGYILCPTYPAYIFRVGTSKDEWWSDWFKPSDKI